MRRNLSSCISILIVFVGVFPAAFPATAAETPVVLTIRPENMNKLRIPQTTELKRDPFNWSEKQIARFRAADKETKSALFAGLSLTGIIWDSKKPLAIINGKMLGAGDRINGVRIIKINKESVLLSKKGARFTLEFESSIVDITSR